MGLVQTGVVAVHEADHGMRQRTLLVIDDSETFRELLELQSAGTGWMVNAGDNLNPCLT